MRRPLVSTLLVSTLAIGSCGPAFALGFGKTTSPSLLGQPLDFTASVHLASDETLERACVSATVRAGENPLSPEQVRVALRASPDPAERVVHVTTLRRIDEPVVTIEIAIGCGARMQRSFVAFLDPPTVQLARAANDASAPAEASGAFDPPSSIAAVRPAAEGRSSRAVRGHLAAARSRAVAVRRDAAPGPVASAGPAAIERRRASRVARATAPAPSAVRGPRLKLDAPIEVAAGSDARREASAVASPATGATSATTLAAAPSAAVASGVADDPEHARLVAELAHERERLHELESGLASLRRDEQALHQTIAALQLRLRDAEAARDANPLVWLLGGACVLLLGATALAWRRTPLRRGWWEATQLPPAQPAAAAAPAPAPAPPSDVEPLAEEPADAPWTYRRPAIEPVSAAAAPAASIGGLEVTTVLDNGLLARMAAGDTQPLAPGSEIAPIDHLVDLEQQVEFYRVLGQEPRAIELLSSSLDGPAGDSPMPHRHLLVLHRRRGERAAWMRVADALHARFGGARLSWTDAAEDEAPLESHAAVIERLQRLWAWPAEAMHALDGWLFGRGTHAERFGYAACAELLLLYGIAREHAEAANTGIDLLLPLEDPCSAEAEPAISVVRISNFGALEVPLRRAVDLDISRPGPLDSRPSELRQAI